MNIVYFFGAGASRAIDARVPLMDFIPIFLEKYPASWDAVRRALNNAQFLEVGRNQFYLQPAPAPILNLEQLLVALEDQVANPDEKIARAAEEAYSLIKALINTSLVDLDREFIQKKSPTLYDIFAEAIRNYPQHRHSVISFNYDPWLERALQKAGCWYPGSGYVSKSDVRGNLDFVGPARKTDKVLPREPESMVKVLKPHGSISWLRTDNPAADPIFILDSDDPSRGLITTLERKEPSVKINGKELRPDVIPPSRFKRIGGDFMYKIYKAIEEELREARAIVIVGWSMPITDVYMTQRIMDGFRDRGKDQNLSFLEVCDVNKTDLFYHRFQAAIPTKSFGAWKHGFSKEFITERLVDHWKKN